MNGELSGSFLTAFILGGVGVVVLDLMLFITKRRELSHIQCPYCRLGFMKELLFIGDYSVTSCVFCHSWLKIGRGPEGVIARRLSENTTVKFLDDAGNGGDIVFGR